MVEAMAAAVTVGAGAIRRGHSIARHVATDPRQELSEPVPGAPGLDFETWESKNLMESSYAVAALATDCRVAHPKFFKS